MDVHRCRARPTRQRLDQLTLVDASSGHIRSASQEIYPARRYHSAVTGLISPPFFLQFQTDHILPPCFPYTAPKTRLSLIFYNRSLLRRIESTRFLSFSFFCFFLRFPRVFFLFFLEAGLKLRDFLIPPEACPYIRPSQRFPQPKTAATHTLMSHSRKYCISSTHVCRHPALRQSLIISRNDIH